MQNGDYIQTYLGDVRRICDEVPREEIDRAIEAIFRAWKDGRTIFLMGNGGSASTATHFAADLTQQAMVAPHARRLRAIALSDNVPLTSALTNDQGWENLYLEQLRSFAQPGDVGIGISVHGGSGKDKAGAWSQNLLRGLQYLKDLGGQTIGLIGFDGGPMKNLVDVPIVVPAESTPLVEAWHVVLHHLIAFRLKERIQEHPVRRAVFLDRDGVINRAIPDERFGVRSPFAREEFELFPHAEEAIPALKKAGYLCILVSNQPDVAYGHLPEEEWYHMHRQVAALPLDDIFLCRHTRDAGCACKKPKPGMLFDAAKKWDISLGDSLFVGDTESDLGAARVVGCKTILIDWPYNRHLESDFRAEHLGHAAQIICENCKE